jgi:hypothetical protein
MLQVIAGVVLSTLFLWSVGFPALVRSVEAASITNASDTLSDSDRGVASNHTIRFTTPNGILASQTIVLTFPSTPDVFTIPAQLFYYDIDILDDGVEQTLATSSAAGTWGVATTSTTITLTAPSDTTVASSSVITIEIGTNATSGTTGTRQIVNPSTTGSYEITVGGSMADSGAFRVAILDNVVVTANVDTTFDFTVAGLATSSSVNGTSTTITSTATAIPFGTLTSGVIQTLAQQLTVTTNADNGFAVTVYQDSNLVSSTGADIDGFANGAYTDTPSAWTDPTANPSDERTWGHWGMTSGDADLFGSNLWVSPSTTPRTVFSHNSVANATTTNVGYQTEISSLQEAGDDYTTTLTYIATPVF